MIHNVGIYSGGNGGSTPTPSYGTLVDKLIDLGFDEIWMHDDSSGGVVALYDSDNDLYPTDGSDNFGYETAFTSFPSMKGLDMSNMSGDKTYLSTSSAVTGLHTTGDLTIVNVGMMKSANGTNRPSIGMASPTSGSSADNILGAVGVRRNGSTAYSHYRHQFGTNSNITYQSLDVGQGNGGDGVEFLQVVVRDSTAEEDSHYVNGEQASNTRSFAGESPSGGSNCKWVEGRDVTNLGSSVREPLVQGLTAMKKGAITEASIKELQDSIYEMGDRFGEVPDSYKRQAFAVNLVDGRCINLSNDSNYTYNFNGDGESVGFTAFISQLSTGKGVINYTGSDSIVGTPETTGVGSILMFKKTGESEWTVTHG